MSHPYLLGRQMCLLCSNRSCSPSSRSSVLDSSSLIFLALLILSKTSQLSLYWFLFPLKRNSGSWLLSLSCFRSFTSSSSIFSFFLNSLEYRFCCAAAPLPNWAVPWLGLEVPHTPGFCALIPYLIDLELAG